MEEKYYIKISPENVIGDLINVVYTANSYVITAITGNCCFISVIPKGVKIETGSTSVYSMRKVLSAGPNGSSLFTGLTIPILIRQNNIDIGYYSVFDGAILQKNVVTNFVFSSDTRTPFKYFIYNTSEKDSTNFLSSSEYRVNWGDGTEEDISNFTPNSHDHIYVNSGKYVITLKQKTPWGLNTISKTISVPYIQTTIDDPFGEAFFTPNHGSWSATPISYKYIYPYDSDNLISNQITSNFINVPISISGFTKSRIEELKLYGPTKYEVGRIVKKNGIDFGQILVMDPISNGVRERFTGYTIEGCDYLDFPDGTTVYLFDTSGLTIDWMVQSAMTKDEALMNVIFDPEIQSDVYIERGKNSALERIERLGEVDNVGDLENYGYGFFNFSVQ